MGIALPLVSLEGSAVEAARVRSTPVSVCPADSWCTPVEPSAAPSCPRTAGSRFVVEVPQKELYTPPSSCFVPMGAAAIW